MSSETSIARWTGAAYLVFTLVGVVGFLGIRSRLDSGGDADQTYANILEHAWLAHLGVTFELLIVMAQAGVALGFYALFRADRPVAAFAVAALGMINAVAILCSAAFLTLAAKVVDNPLIAPGGDAAGAVGLAFSTADSFWAVGAVFFGLWLLPMGWFILSTGRMPRVLGGVLVVGGVGYIISALLASAVPTLPAVVDKVLTVPATIGEFWMIGYLLVKGIRAHTASDPVDLSA